LLSDPHFENDDVIVDECMTFFLAGSVTTASTTSNVISQVVKNMEIESKLFSSLAKNFKSFGDTSKTCTELAEEINLESLDMAADEYLKYCFNEALRYDPPAPFKSSVCMTEDVEIAGFKVQQGEMMLQNIY